MSEAVTILQNIEATLRAILGLLKEQVPPPVATDAELDGKYGNPILKFTPRDWSGPSFKEKRFSECPPELLDLVASMNDYFARKADENNEKTEKGTPVSKYKRADAARARGWAKRLRAGWASAAPSFDSPAPAQGPSADPWATPPAGEATSDEDLF
jgi:hypothetical protein